MIKKSSQGKPYLNLGEKIIRDQMKFFNANATKTESGPINNSLFDQYVNKEQRESFKWIEDKKIILEYGCGTGDSLDKFFEQRNRSNYQIYGVDIAKNAIDRSMKKYPESKFYVIKNNKMPRIKNGTIEAAFLFHVLHHSKEHAQIFREIHKKLNNNGKLLINDLSSRNPIINLFRFLFIYSPKFIKGRFADDLVCDDHIPDKYKVDTKQIVELLTKNAFEVDEVGYGHLFFFIFSWLERFIPLSQISMFRSLYLNLMRLEANLLNYPFFQRWAEVYYIKACKVKT